MTIDERIARLVSDWRCGAIAGDERIANAIREIVAEVERERDQERRWRQDLEDERGRLRGWLMEYDLRADQLWQALERAVVKLAEVEAVARELVEQTLHDDRCIDGPCVCVLARARAVQG